jgi:hypothetical protein
MFLVFRIAPLGSEETLASACGREGSILLLPGSLAGSSEGEQRREPRGLVGTLY